MEDEKLSEIYMDFLCRRAYNVSQLSLRRFFYGEGMDEAVKQTAQKLVKANALNLYCSEVQICFRETADFTDKINFITV